MLVLGAVAKGLLLMALPGCVAAIPLAINYFSTPSEYVATAEVTHPAGDVYEKVVREAEGAGAGMRIISRKDAERLLQISDGVQTATIKVIEEGRGETQIIVTASKVERAEEKELAVQVLLHLCDRYGEVCRVRK